MNNFFLNILFLLIASFLFFCLAQAPVLAAPDYGLNTTANEFNDKIPAESRDISVPVFIGKIINVILSFLGIIFLILIIYGGFLWMTAGGKEEKVSKAIQIFTNASIGLIVVISAYLITRFIGSAIINSLQ